MHPFELGPEELRGRLDDMVEATFSDIQSEFLILPRGPNYVDYADFQASYETLKRHTRAFQEWTPEAVWQALREDSLTFVILRTMLGVSPPEWVDLAREQLRIEIPQGAARGLDVKVRKSNPDTGKRDYLASPGKRKTTMERVDALVKVAVATISQGTEKSKGDTLHRLAKVDTAAGLDSLRHVATHHIPYAMLLYERYLGRPFASHRDSVSELVGDVMENAIEDRLLHSKVSFRKTKRAERVPGFEQAPDFFIPDEIAPSVIVEAKITGDDGTARDKVARILRLAAMRDERRRNGEKPFQVVACIDGRGFGVRRQDMRDMLIATEGKVFTLATLDQLISSTGIAGYSSQPR